FLFFFQAEDGIRDFHVTGVQTCALPIFDDVILAVNGVVINGNLDQWLTYFDEDEKRITINRAGRLVELVLPEVNRNFYMEYKLRSEERRVGKECRSGWATLNSKKNTAER